MWVIGAAVGEKEGGDEETGKVGCEKMKKSEKIRMIGYKCERKKYHRSSFPSLVRLCLFL